MFICQLHDKLFECLWETPCKFREQWDVGKQFHKCPMRHLKLNERDGDLYNIDISVGKKKRAKQSALLDGLKLGTILEGDEPL